MSVDRIAISLFTIREKKLSIGRRQYFLHWDPPKSSKYKKVKVSKLGPPKLSVDSIAVSLFNICEFATAILQVGFYLYWDPLEVLSVEKS